VTKALLEDCQIAMNNSMEIICSGLGKKFQNQWIFSNFTHTFLNNSSTAIVGFNGSGKSTLLGMLSGYISPSKGEINFHLNNNTVTNDDLYKYISIGAPYLDIPEELTPSEIINTFSPFKPFHHQLNEKDILTLLRLDNDKNKAVKYFSSGMKQRLKIGMAILSDTPLLLLDEPLSNLDKDGGSWFSEMIKLYRNNKTLIIASNNIEQEIEHCDSIININDYKKS